MKTPGESITNVQRAAKITRHRPKILVCDKRSDFSVNSQGKPQDNMRTIPPWLGPVPGGYPVESLVWEEGYCVSFFVKMNRNSSPWKKHNLMTRFQFQTKTVKIHTLRSRIPTNRILLLFQVSITSPLKISVPDDDVTLLSVYFGFICYVMPDREQSTTC